MKKEIINSELDIRDSYKEGYIQEIDLYINNINREVYVNGRGSWKINNKILLADNQQFAIIEYSKIPVDTVTTLTYTFAIPSSEWVTN